MKKIIIMALILISIISCNSKKTDNAEVTANTNAVNTNKLTSAINTNTLETNTKEYEGYATNIYYSASSAEKYSQAIADFNLIKDKASLDEWQSKYTDQTPIKFAIDYYPTEEKAIELISYGADVNQKDFMGLTPLMNASINGYVKLAIELINHNADVNARELDSRGNISADSLFYAVNANNSLELVKVLLNSGANPNIVYSDPEEGNFTILDRSLYYNNFEIFKTLVENGANIDKVNDRGEPFIVNAIRRERFDIVKYLVEKGIDPTMKYTDYRNIPFSLLAATVNNNDTKIAEYLIDKGADVNTKAIIDNYMENDMTSNDKDDSKEAVNLILTAIENGNTSLVKLLIEKGADTTVVNKKKKTVFDIAREKGYDDILALEK
ncbi:ankyrin repeat domain-containing protein [Brachyspira hyodysenteriae]|uniref:Ankyrin repeat-containing protein n=1 Tax=Brachyspira hyodysenteriae (strain ATCC 49526 / WA1) TaxID=565034 RepID=A0A3B6VB25_BRAHW|nr:ankyrin repeat domain-containing protein [Brachyspira hyodysenteriae]ACN83607.1 ankyrin repeat-containing protein [Brachyspira hyodysenteriae WA1]KLI41916.1 ankyrin [Brachyspira hyodysenteriae]KLI45019.1 ankyrin [Brachyspira hyodysenteriae]KLI54186.1 ankyrin [Brachyspira hyodysenteriae]MDA0034396.1 ankyrin repeat domain-containing protein [Brachyspira hyodysenteriae]